MRVEMVSIQFISQCCRYSLPLDDSCGNSHRRHAFWQILRHDRTSANDRPSADLALFDDRSPGTNIAAFTELYVTAEGGVGVEIAEVTDPAVMGDAGFYVKDNVAAYVGAGGDEGTGSKQCAITN